MDRSLEDLRSSVRAIEHKLDNLRMDAAIAVGVLPLKPGHKFWVATEIDWDDPKIPREIHDKYFSLLDKRYELNYQAARREAEEKNELPRFEARQVAYGWLKILGDKSDAWLIEHHLTTITLTEEILNNPGFLEEVMNV